MRKVSESSSKMKKSALNQESPSGRGNGTEIRSLAISVLRFRGMMTMSHNFILTQEIGLIRKITIRTIALGLKRKEIQTLDKKSTRAITTNSIRTAATLTIHPITTTNRITNRTTPAPKTVSTTTNLNPLLLTHLTSRTRCKKQTTTQLA